MVQAAGGAMARRRVVVTGVGMVTPLGHDVNQTWAALLRCASGVGPITLFDASQFPTRIAAEVKGFSLAAHGEAEVEFAGRNVGFAVAAAKEALADAGLLPVGAGAAAGFDPSRAGIYLGAGEGQPDFLNFVTLVHKAWHPGRGGAERFDPADFIRMGEAVLHPMKELEQEPAMPSSHLARRFGLRGPTFNSLTACAASAQAIGEATGLLRRGDADIILAGGTHSMIHPFGVTGFVLLTALSRNNDDPQGASRPFDRLRDGFVLGEGAGMLVLEEREHALARNATIHGEILGYGTTGDAFRVTDTHPEGRGAVACMSAAIADAGLEPKDIGYVNAHGTSTDVNDRVETLAIKKVFGDLAPKLPVSSTKSMTGHLIAAGGAVETIFCLRAIREGVLPPTINQRNPDPECDLDYIPNEPRSAQLDYAMENSFGFGGQNISLVVGRHR